MRLAAALKLVLKIAVSGGILGVLVGNLQSESLAKTLAAFSLGNLLWILSGYLLVQLLCAYKWQILAGSMGFQGVLRSFFSYYLKGMFFGLFLPTGIGGDVGRAMLLSRDQGRRWIQAFLSTLAERLCGLSGLLLFICIGFNWLHPPEWSWLAMLGLTGFALFTFAFTLFFQAIRHHPVGHTLIQRFVLKDQPDEDTHWPSKSASAFGIVLSLAAHAGLVCLQLTILGLLGVNAPFLLVATISGLAALAAMVPISLNGIGLREGAIVILLSHWGHVPVELATTYSLIWLSTLLLAALPGGLLLLRTQIVPPALKNI